MASPSSLLITLLTLCIVCNSCLAQKQCHIDSECVFGKVAGNVFAKDYNSCLQLCRTNRPTCKYFTFYKSTQDCILYEDCDLDPEESLCEDCLTGESACPLLDPTCHLAGSCLGNLIDFLPVTSKDRCLQECKGLEGCFWYTFNSELCYLFSDCVLGFDERCDTCVTGEVSCPTPDLKTKLMIVSSNPFPDVIEVIDLTPPSNRISRFPHAHEGRCSAFVQGRPMVCGGWDVKSCYTYSKDSWSPATSMNVARDSAAGVMINETHWWVTGGYDRAPVKSTEIYNAITEQWSFYSDMPQGNDGHCLVKINDTHFFMGGGYYSGERAYLFDVDLQRWERLPDVSLPRFRPACGVVTRSNGEKEIVIAGGSSGTETSSTSETFSLSKMSWRVGTELPYPIEMASGVQDKDTFLVVGGRSGPVYYDRILRYDPLRDDWILLPQRLENGKGVYSAILLPY